MATHIGYGKFYNPDGINVLNVPVYSASLPSKPGLYSFTGAENIGGVTPTKIFPLINFDQSGDVSPSNTLSSGSDASDFIGFQASSSNQGTVFVTSASGSSTQVFPTQYGSDDYDAIIIVQNTVTSKYVPVNFSTSANKIVLTGYEPGVTALGLVDVPDPPIPEIDSFVIDPNRAYIETGDVIQFTAFINDIETHDGIVWSLVPDTMSEGSIQLEGVSISEDGLVTVGEFTANKILVKALSTLYSRSQFAYLWNKNNPYGPDGNSGPGGGGGTFNPGQSDDVATGVPQGSNIGKDSSTGMYTRYLMNPSYLELLGAWMWDPNLGLSLIKTALESWYGEKNSEALISLLSFPFSLSIPLTGVNTVDQKLFFGHTPVGEDNFKALTSGSCQMDWGTISLEEYWGNFLDYAPHTKIELYLPWGTGFVELDPGQCLPGTISVKTNIEFARGSCVHNVINQSGTVIGTYMGQPGSFVPLISSDISAKRAGLAVAAVSLGVGGAVSAGASAVGEISQATAASYYTSIMTGRRLGVSASKLSESASKVASEVMQEGNRIASDLTHGSGFASRLASRSAQAALRRPAIVQRNGGFADASAGMMVQYPYVIISRPEQNVPEGYGHFYGYPSNITSSLQFIKGYTEISSIHLNGIPCTDGEMAELEKILAGGVVF